MRKIKKLCEIFFGFIVIGVGVCDVVVGVPQTIKDVEDLIDDIHDDLNKKPPVQGGN